jgi:hypothetical protein
MPAYQQSLKLSSGLTIAVGCKVSFKTGDEYFDGRPARIDAIYKLGDGRFYVSGEIAGITPSPSYPRGSSFSNVLADQVVALL